MRTSAEKLTKHSLNFRQPHDTYFIARRWRVAKAPTFTEKLKRCKNIVIFKTQRKQNFFNLFLHPFCRLQFLVMFDYLTAGMMDPRFVYQMLLSNLARQL